MSRRSKKVRKAAELAAKNTTNAFEEVFEQVAPKAKKTSKQAVDAITPVLSNTKDTIEDLYEQHLAPRVADTVDLVSPVVTQAYESISEHFDNDVQPHLADWLGQVQDDKAEVVVPKAKKRCSLGKLFALLGVAAFLGALVLVVREVLGTKDDGWAPAAPNPKEDPHRDGQAKRAETGKIDYGEGSYVGENPPAEFWIKGNERSMKYHTPNSMGYERTNADVWFATEEAAQAAGFTRALR